MNTGHSTRSATLSERNASPTSQRTGRNGAFSFATASKLSNGTSSTSLPGFRRAATYTATPEPILCPTSTTSSIDLPDSFTTRSSTATASSTIFSSEGQPSLLPYPR